MRIVTTINLLIITITINANILRLLIIIVELTYWVYGYKDHSNYDNLQVFLLVVFVEIKDI